MTKESEQVLEGLIIELKRGTLVLSVLSQLAQQQYGYSLIVTLQEKGLVVDGSTLYPLLRRLEKQELLKSEWDTEGTKPRKYYIRTEQGTQIYEKLCEEWRKMVLQMEKFVGGENKDAY